MVNKVKLFLALAVVMALVLAGAGSALAQEVPPIPADYSGYVYVGGEKAGAGLQVSAKIEDYTSASVTTDANGFYFFLVVGPSDATYVGKTVHFYVNGVEATETDTFAGGSSHDNFTLHIAALPAGGGGGGGGIGGGGGGISSHIETNLFGSEESFDISDEGEIEETIEATSEDGNLTITIEDGTITLEEDGTRLESLEVAVDETPPDPPEDTYIIGLAYNFGPAGATFDPPITLEYTYDPDDLPEGVAPEDLVIAYWDGDEWVELVCVVDTVNNTITAEVEHFTTFAIIGAVTPPEEEEVVPPEEEEVVPPEEEEEVVLPPEEEVVPPEEVAPAKPPVNWPVLGGIIGGVIVVGLLIFFLVRRRRAY